MPLQAPPGQGGAGPAAAPTPAALEAALAEFDALLEKGDLAGAKASALDLGPFGITVNCIAPGPIGTEMPMSILSQEQQR